MALKKIILDGYEYDLILESLFNKILAIKNSPGMNPEKINSMNTLMEIRKKIQKQLEY